VNDQDPDGESVTAVLVTPTAHGALALHADGSFTYTPQAGVTGTDTFVYRAVDDVGAFTPPTIVTIVVQ